MKQMNKALVGISLIFGIQAIGAANYHRLSDDDDDMMMHWKMPLMTDSDFLDAAIAGQNCEIALGRLAQKNGSDSFTSSFGNMMVRDHGKALDDLEVILSTRRTYGSASMSAFKNLRQDLTESDQRTYNWLGGMSGSSFDDAYRHQMIEDHKMALRMFKMEAVQATDPDLRLFASKYIPAIKNHLMALKNKTMP